MHRYGALSGFGLSLTKWTLIVKKSADFAAGRINSGGNFGTGGGDASGSGTNHNYAASVDNGWLWWLVMAFGLLV